MPEADAKQSNMWGMLCHLTALAGIIGIPFGNIIGPLVVWLVKKEEFPFVDEQGKESLNFQISMTIYAVVAGLLCFVLIGIPLLILIWLVDLVLIIIASLKANEGKSYRYPVTIRLLK
jgi:uncharacterized Tic20 family protein